MESVCEIVAAQQLNTLNALKVLFNSSRSAIHLLNALKRRRRKHITILLQLQKRRVALLAEILSGRTSPRYRIQKRSTGFWEHDMKHCNDQVFKENFKMDRESFKILCQKLGGISRSDTMFRKCVPVDKRVAIAVYALGSSAEYRTVGNLFGVRESTVRKIVLQFGREVWKVRRRNK